ncbi:MAG: hypothetical protein ACRD0G_03580 [Acidimicrobiales bacterium]
MSSHRRALLRRWGAGVTGALLAAVVGLAAGLPSSAVTPPSTAVPAGIPDDDIWAAKVAWSRFVADNFATPDAIHDPCPLLAADAATAHVQALGLVPSALPYGVELYRDATGTGIIGIRCGVDLAEPADPAESTGFAVEVTLLDGQAVFPQYVVRVAGQNTPITPSPELSGDVSGRCRFEPTVCVASWHGDGLVVTVRLDGPRTDESEAQTFQALGAITPEVVANLAAAS